MPCMGKLSRFLGYIVQESTFLGSGNPKKLAQEESRGIKRSLLQINSIKELHKGRDSINH